MLTVELYFQGNRIKQPTHRNWKMYFSYAINERNLKIVNFPLDKVTQSHPWKNKNPVKQKPKFSFVLC